MMHVRSTGTSPEATQTARLPIVLILAGYYLPGFRGGGPVRSVANLVAALGEHFSFKIVAWDRDLGMDRPYDDIPRGWTLRGNAAVIYLSQGLRAFWDIATTLRHEQYDVLYLQSFFDPRLGLWPLLLRKLGIISPRRVVLAPRGQFSPGALAIKPRRKEIAISVGRLLMRGDEAWQATAVEEASYIRSHYPNAHVTVAANVPSPLNAVPPRTVKQPGVLRAIYLSRITPKKNLLGALDALRSLRGEVTFDIYGPAEDAQYWQKCQDLIATIARPELRITHRGDVRPEKVSATFANYDVFLFPTHGENFGHVILEALVAGCPCILSDQTPWRGLSERRAGWDLPLSRPELFSEALQTCVDADENEMARLRDGARALAEQYIAKDGSAAATIELLSLNVGPGSPSA